MRISSHTTTAIRTRNKLGTRLDSLQTVKDIAMIKQLLRFFVINFILILAVLSNAASSTFPEPRKESIQISLSRVSNQSVRVVGETIDLSKGPPSFHTGDHLLLRYKASFNSHVYIINSAPTGESTLQFPSKEGEDVTVPLNAVREFQFVLSGAPGDEEFIIIVTRVKIDNEFLSQIVDRPDKLLISPIVLRQTTKGSRTDSRRKGRPSSLQRALSEYPSREFIDRFGDYFHANGSSLSKNNFAGIQWQKPINHIEEALVIPKIGKVLEQITALRLVIRHEANTERAETPGDPGSRLDHKQFRAALIIGNSSYEAMSLWFATDVHQSINNDATEMGNALSKLGFSVTLKKDLNHDEMAEELKKFAEKMRDSDGIGVFYYSGIGREVRGRNYLIPIDVASPDRDGFETTAVEVQNMVDSLTCRASSPRCTRVIFLDAGPFSEISAADNTIVGIAGQTGKKLNDNKFGQKNSIYTEALLEFLPKPNMSTNRLFSDVTEYVKKKTLSDPSGPQIPRAVNANQSKVLFPKK